MPPHGAPSPTDEQLCAIADAADGSVAMAGVETIILSADGRSWTTTRAAH